MRFDQRFVLLILLTLQVALLALLWRADIITPDFYPLYLGAQLVLQGQSPYGSEATRLLMALWDAPEPFPRAGIAYPFPVLVLVAPLATLPYAAAAIAWVALGLGLVALLQRLPGVPLLTPALSWPLFWSVAIGQATLIWSGFAVALLVGMRERSAWLVGLCIALLPLKPQSGLLFALAGAWWAWRESRMSLVWAGASAAVLGALAFALQPAWVQGWLEQVSVYNAAVRPISLLPWLVPLLAACWRLPWWSKLALLQVFLFPLVRQEYGIDPYTVVLLVLVWCGIGGRLALAGLACSWLWPIVLLSGFESLATPLTLFLPLVVCGAWRSWFTAGQWPWQAGRGYR